MAVDNVDVEDIPHRYPPLPSCMQRAIEMTSNPGVHKELEEANERNAGLPTRVAPNRRA